MCSVDSVQLEKRLDLLQGGWDGTKGGEGKGRESKRRTKRTKNSKYTASINRTLQWCVDLMDCVCRYSSPSHHCRPFMNGWVVLCASPHGVILSQAMTYEF